MQPEQFYFRVNDVRRLLKSVGRQCRDRSPIGEPYVTVGVLYHLANLVPDFLTMHFVMTV